MQLREGKCMLNLSLTVRDTRLQQGRPWKIQTPHVVGHLKLERTKYQRMSQGTLLQQAGRGTSRRLDKFFLANSYECLSSKRCTSAHFLLFWFNIILYLKAVQHIDSIIMSQGPIFTLVIYIGQMVQDVTTLMWAKIEGGLVVSVPAPDFLLNRRHVRAILPDQHSTYSPSDQEERAELLRIIC